MDENAKLLANLFCLMQGANAAFAKQFFGVWCYTDGIVVHSVKAMNKERDGHLDLFRRKLTEHKIVTREFSHCECHQCWAFILDGDKKEAELARRSVWQSAFQVVGMPPVVPPKLENAVMPPDIPTIPEHVAFIRNLHKYGLIRCGRMVTEGQRRTKSK